MTDGWIKVNWSPHEKFRVFYFWLVRITLKTSRGGWAVEAVWNEFWGLKRVGNIKNSFYNLQVENVSLSLLQPLLAETMDFESGTLNNEENFSSCDSLLFQGVSVRRETYSGMLGVFQESHKFKETVEIRNSHDVFLISRNKIALWSITKRLLKRAG